MPQVAVIIPAYNQSQYLSQAIQSVLDQTFTDWEAVIVDDGSSDDTRHVAHSFTDSRLRYIYQENRGLSAARNTGIRNSTAPYSELPGLGRHVSSREISPPAGRPGAADRSWAWWQGRQYLWMRTTSVWARSWTHLCRNNRSDCCWATHCTWAACYCAEAGRKQAGFFDESLRSYEDWDMWLRLGCLGCRMSYVNKPVSLYRFHTAQMTRIGTQMTTATFAVLDKLYAKPELPPAWQELHDQAYSRAYLRAAAQAYHATQYDYAKNCIENAIQLNPSLVQDDGQLLTNTFSGWIDLPKTSQPLEFLETIYDNLPENLQALQRRKRQNVGKAAIQLAFYSYQQGDMAMTRYAIRHAFRCQPRYLLNRGALAIFLHSLNA